MRMNATAKAALATADSESGSQADHIGIGRLGSTLACITGCIFFLRDSLAGFLRYYLDVLHVGSLWFVPDLLAVVGFLLLVWGPVLKLRSPLATLILIQFWISLAIGIVFMSSSTVAIVSSVKLFLPIATGYAMAGQSFTDTAWKRRTLLTTLIICMTGLLIAPYVNFPWVGAELQAFGLTRTANRQWWSDSETQRYGGFAYDNTSAAFVCVFLYIVLHKSLSPFLRIALVAPISLALWYSNSKTAIITWVLYLIFIAFIHKKTDEQQYIWARKSARLSFFLVPIPVILMISVSGLDLLEVSKMLISIQDRINNTWQFPFLYLSENNPILALTGCGLGCFTYPMFYTDLTSINVPLDNYYLTSIITFGSSFLIVIAGMLFLGTNTQNREKLHLIMAFNIYSVTVQCYGPACTGFLLAYAFSDMFLTSNQIWRRKIFGHPGDFADKRIEKRRYRPARVAKVEIM